MRLFAYESVGMRHLPRTPEKCIFAYVQACLLVTPERYHDRYLSQPPPPPPPKNALMHVANMQPHEKSQTPWETDSAAGTQVKIHYRVVQ